MLGRILLVAAAASLVAPAAAQAGGRTSAIVLQVSIRGVEIGMTPHDVHTTLGSPDESRIRQSPILGRTRVWRFGGVTVTFNGTRRSSKVVTVSTTSHKEYTAAGVGIGSSEAMVQVRVPGATCATSYGFRHCWVGRQMAGRIVTDFSISTSGTVTRITVGRVLD